MNDSPKDENEEKIERQADEVYRRYLESFPKWAVWSWVVMARQAFEELRSRMERGEVPLDRPFFAYYSLARYERTRDEAGDWPGPTFWDFVEAFKSRDGKLATERFIDFVSTDFFREATYSVWRTPTEGGKWKVTLPELDSDTNERGTVLNAIREHIREGGGFGPEVRNMTAEFVQEPFRFGVEGLVERFDEKTSTAIMKHFFRNIEQKVYGWEEEATAGDGIGDELFEKEDFLGFLNDPLSFTLDLPDSYESIVLRAIVEVSPLYVEPDQGRASFPVVVGIEAIYDMESIPLTNVPPEAMNELWKQLFEVLDKVKGEESESETDLLRLLDGFFEAPPESSALPALPVRTILDAPTREDALVRAQISQLNRIKLPTKWEKIRPWETLEGERIKAILAEHGEDEAVLQKLLKRTTVRENGEKKTVLKLGEKEREALRDSLEGKAFRERRRGPGGGVEYAIVKRIRTADGGVLEFALSWYGMDWKLVEGGRKLAEEAFEGILRKNEQRLFPELSSSQIEEVREETRHIRFLRDSDRLMGLLLDRFGVLGTNVFRIPLWEVKALFEIENDPHALDRINGAFYNLGHLNFTSIRSGKRPSEGGYGYGPFLVFYELPKSLDGDIIVEVSVWAIGALRFFERGRKAYPYPVLERPEDPKNKPTGEIVSHDFGKAMDRAAKKSLSKELKNAGTRISHKPTSSSAHFVNALAEGDEKQKDKVHRLLNFIGTELTKRGDPQKGTRKRRAGKELEEAGRPRVYGRDFCPLLDEKALAGALGHHKHNPESGRRIYGGAPHATSKSGAFPEGLLSLLGYHETTRAGKARDVREALLLMEDVVGAKLEGLVALKLGDSWLRVSEAIANEADLPTVGREARVFLFVPEDYGDRLPTIYNAYSERRAKEQALPYVPQITKDRALHERNDLERPTKTPIVEVEATAKVRTLDEVTPLHRRLAGARNGRDLTQKEVGELFGVSAQTIKLWETFERDELGKTTKGRPIPKQIAPLLERWLRERIAPTKEELDSLTKRREGRRKADRES